VMVLDGVIQLTERDEMSYQEMLAQLPMFSHKNPKNVLVIGGGDGGMIREICKHKCVEKITMCDIDEGVPNASKRFFPKQSTGFKDPRVTLKIGDGVAFAEAAADNTYDVIVVDSSDPVGPAEKLFSAEFYANAHRILSPGGVMCTQSECLWINYDLISTMMKEFGKPFYSAEYASIQTPTYPAGQIGAFLARKADPTQPDLERSLKTPARVPSAEMENELDYYSEEMHVASFALPAFMQRRLNSAGEPAPKKTRTE